MSKSAKSLTPRNLSRKTYTSPALFFSNTDVLIMTRHHADLQVPGVAEVNPTGLPRLSKPSRTPKSGEQLNFGDNFSEEIENKSYQIPIDPFKGLDEDSVRALSTYNPLGTKTWHFWNIQGCFREVLENVWRYFWKIFGDQFGTYLRGFGGDFEMFLDSFREGF